MGELAAWHPWYITANQRGPRVREVIYVVYRSRLPIIATVLASRSLLRLHARGKRKVFRYVQRTAAALKQYASAKSD